MTMKTKRSQEGYVLIDHRNSPGISPEFIAKNKLDAPAVGAGVTFESALSVCHHCHADVILNPNRSRERGWCWACDHYICDACNAAKQAGAPCMPFKAKFARFYEKLIRGLLPTQQRSD